MTLIEIFAEYVRNQKDLKAYVEERKNIHTRGEFNDKTLLKAQDALQRLKKEHPDIYTLMYKTLDDYYTQDEGHRVEYPIDFIRQVLKIYQQNVPAQKVYECYKKGLNHQCRDA